MSANEEELNCSAVSSSQLKRNNSRGCLDSAIILRIPPGVLIRSYEMLGLSVPELLKHRQVCKIFKLALMKLHTYVKIWSVQQNPPDNTDESCHLTYSSCQVSAFIARLTLVAHLVRGPLRLSFGENSPLTDSQGADDVYSACASFAHLESINLRGNLFTDKLVHALMQSSATTLRELDLSAIEDRSSCLTENGLMAIATNCTHLTTIKVSNQYWLTDDSVTTLFNNNRDLEVIELNTGFLRSMPGDLPNPLSDACLTALGNSCPSVRVLHIRSQPFTDIGLCAIAAGCRNLKELDLSMPKKRTVVSRYTDEGCMMIATGCPRLKRISLNGCKKLSDKSIIFLYTHCPHLNYFDLKRTNITDSLIRNIACALGPKLKYLDIRGCKKLTDLAEYFVYRNSENAVYKNDHDNPSYDSEASWFVDDAYGLGYEYVEDDDY